MTSIPGRVHVVGAGLAGLAAAVTVVRQGRAVSLYESARQAGGRCRSFFDAELGCRIDNGNHLLLAGNRAAMTYLERIGARDTLEAAAETAFPFVDAADGARWTLRPNPGRLPWWILSAGRRVPGTRPGDYLAALSLHRADAATTVAGALKRDALFRRLWEPLAVAALNTSVEQGAAGLFWKILVDTLGRGGAACRPMLPRDGLSETFVDPALRTLIAHGADIRFGERLRAIAFDGDRIASLDFDGGPVPIEAADRVILATPAPIAGRLVPGLVVPDLHAAIVNAHFRYDAETAAPPFVGVVGGTAEWVFCKRGILSVTVSAADHLLDRPAAELLGSLWRDVVLAYRLPPQAAPPARLVKERRATFLASPAQLARRPVAATRWKSLLLAGDYTDTGLPATMEGAIRSGFVAAAQALKGRPITAGTVSGIDRSAGSDTDQQQRAV